MRGIGSAKSRCSHVARDRLREARAAGAAVELMLAVEQRQVTGGADDAAAARFLVQRAAGGAPRAFLKQHVKRGRADLAAPQGIGSFNAPTVLAGADSATALCVQAHSKREQPQHDPGG